MSIEVNNLLVNPNFFNSFYPLIFIKTSSLHTKNYNLEGKKKKKIEDYILKMSKLPSKRVKLLKAQPTKVTSTKTKLTIFLVINTSSITRILAIL